jgi:DNA repair exonuclease SbcCD ATPase subunit
MSERDVHSILQELVDETWGYIPTTPIEKLAVIIDENVREEHAELEQLRAELEQAKREEFDRGRAVGREDVGKYSNAIGLIESALGISGATPLGETVKAVERLATELEQAKARIVELDEVRREALTTLANTEEELAEAESERDSLRERVAELTKVNAMLKRDQWRPYYHESDAAITLERIQKQLRGLLVTIDKLLGEKQ